MTVIFRSPSIKETPYGGQISTSIFIDDSMVAVALAQNAGDSVWGLHSRSRSSCRVPLCWSLESRGY